MKILLVDDSRAMRMIVRRTLHQAGFGGHDFSEAADGALGLDAVRASRPDLVLSDWNMPNMNGIEFLRALRAESCDVPFGFVTSEGTAEMRGLATDAGALFVITKPFTVDVFSATLAPHIG